MKGAVRNGLREEEMERKVEAAATAEESSVAR